MEGSRQRGLDVAEQRINSFELGVLRGLATAADRDRRVQIHCGPHRSTRELEQATCQYLDQRNADHISFVWTKL